MNNWQDDLLKKAKEINPKLLEGGEINGKCVSDRGSDRNSNNDSRSFRNTVSKERRKNINIGKGGESMITSKAVFEDYENIINNKELSDIAKLVQISRIILKLLVGIRTNQRGGVAFEKKERPEVKKPSIEKK